jgi:UDP-GlcNAc:undecaprenyl-phosphate GlcNAc-1-phosphate transferase
LLDGVTELTWLALVIVFIVTFLSIHLLAKQGENLKLMAHPGDHRKHQKATPMVGGIGIYLGILLGFFILDRSFYLLLPSLVFLCVLGALDDRYKLPSTFRFVTQGLAVILMIWLTGTELHSLGYLVSREEVVLGRLATPVTVFACVGVINAINMSDGLDGLAGSLVLMTLLSLLGFSGSDSGLILIAVFAVGGFLAWNLRIGRARASVFMGDAGSTMLGLLIAYLLVKYSQTDGNLWPVTALWLLALPLFDAIGVLLVRPLRGRSPFSADRIHYHHQLLDKGLSVNKALVVSLLLQLLFTAIGVVLWHFRVADHLQFYLFLAVFLAYLWLLLNKTNSRPEGFLS